ncbi:MAG: hypothetical protein ACJAYM_001825 [Flavobacteriales bacterium]|jgi:hypothetical protein
MAVQTHQRVTLIQPQYAMMDHVFYLMAVQTHQRVTLIRLQHATMDHVSLPVVKDVQILLLTTSIQLRPLTMVLVSFLDVHTQQQQIMTSLLQLMTELVSLNAHSQVVQILLQLTTTPELIWMTDHVLLQYQVVQMLQL